MRRRRRVTVGEDITCPAQIASGGLIRIRSERAAEVARLFGLGRHKRPSEPTPIGAELPEVELRPGTITLIGGASGAGKSTLLRAALTSSRHRDRTILDLSTLATRDDAALVDCFDGLSLRESLEHLARVGLGEAWTYLRTPAELSEGQRWRFRLAVALHRATNSTGATHAEDVTNAAVATSEADATNAAGALEMRPLIVCDEFAAVLDRVTACVVAHRLRRAIDAAPGVAALVATSHDDLRAALAPEVTIRCDFGRHEVVERPKMK